MKIAQLVCALPPYAGGIGNSAQAIGQVLAKKHEVTNYAPVNLKSWIRIGHGALSPQLLTRLRRFDYIYLHYPYFGDAEIAWLFLLFHPKTKLIIHYHMDVKFNNPWFKLLALPSKLIKKSLFKRAQTIVCSSLDYVQSGDLQKIYKKMPHKFQAIPFGLDLDHFQPSDLRQASSNRFIDTTKKIINFVNDSLIKKNRTSFLFVGGLDKAHYFKGVDNLIQALSRLESRDWELKVAGEGNLRPSYEALAERLNIKDKIKFLGKISGSELVKEYQRADTLVLPSINGNEAFGLVLIEALACATPVIASNLPGVRTVFADQQQGLLIKPNDINDLQAKLLFMMENKAEREKMGQAGRQLAVEKYDINKTETRLLDLFN